MAEGDLFPIYAKCSECIGQCAVGINKRSVEVADGNFAFARRTAPPLLLTQVISVVSSRDETARNLAIR